MPRLSARIRGTDIVVDVPSNHALGWRFWSLGGFPNDPIDPRPYGGTRCLPLAPVKTATGDRWLCAMELDASLRLFTPHELFPCADQDGADAFARSMLVARPAPLRPPEPSRRGEGEGGDEPD